jgi:hypothetical protein
MGSLWQKAQNQRSCQKLRTLAGLGSGPFPSKALGRPCQVLPLPVIAP